MTGVTPPERGAPARPGLARADRRPRRSRVLVLVAGLAAAAGACRAPDGWRDGEATASSAATAEVAATENAPPRVADARPEEASAAAPGPDEVPPGAAVEAPRVAAGAATARAAAGPEGAPFAWLPAGAGEAPGFGLYSYLLLGSAPTLRNEDRYRRTLAALLSQRPSAAPVEAGHGPGRRSVTYVPVRSAPPAGEHVDAEWILRNYDHDRARALLARLRGSYSSGPYVVSVAEPLADPASPVLPRLEQDLSACTLRLIDPWIGAFVDRAAGVEFWRASRLHDLGLDLRADVARAGESVDGAPVPVPQLVDWIDVRH